MDESTIRGMELLELNDGGAASRKTSIPYAKIYVEGYDTSLQAYTLKLALTKHFSSCGKVTYVNVPRDYKRGFLKSVAFMTITGEDCLDKALKLSGTDVGGWILIVKTAPSQTQLMDQNKPKEDDPHKIRVTGYNTWLPEIDLQMALCNHFSSCGEVIQVNVLKSSAYVLLLGGRCVENALKLSGSNMGGMILVVDAAESRPKSARSARKPTGYMPLSSLIRHAKKKKQKMEMEMDMVMDEKKKKKMKKELMKIDEEIRRHMEKKKKQDTDWERRMEMENFEKSLF